MIDTQERRRQWGGCSGLPLAVVTLAAATVAAGCTTPPAPADAMVIRIAPGGPNGPFRAAGEALAQRYRTVLPNASPELVMTRGGADHVTMAEDGTADIAFAYANIAYAGFVGQMRDQAVPFEGLRGMALLQPSALHVVSAPVWPGRRIEDLDDQTVYRLTQALYESSSAAAIDPVLGRWLDESVGAATPVPLHPGAARYYRERELTR